MFALLTKPERGKRGAQIMDLDSTAAAGDQPAAVDPCEAAASWAAFLYQLDGTEVVVRPLEEPSQEKPRGCRGRAVVLPDLRRIEAVFDATTDFSGALAVLQDFVAEQWAVWALVPLGRLGEAHQAFSGTVDFLQGWWPRDARAFAFTQPEVP